MSVRGAPSDASAIIYLAKAGGLAAARARFGPLLMPPGVWDEVVTAGARQGRSEVAVVERCVSDGDVREAGLDGPQRRRAQGLRSRFGLGVGESEILALGRAYELVLIDDHRATRAASALGIRSIETILIPALCVQAGVLDAAGAFELLAAIARHTTIPAELALRVRRLIEEAKP